MKHWTRNTGTEVFDLNEIQHVLQFALNCNQFTRKSVTSFYEEKNFKPCLTKRLQCERENREHLKCARNICYFYPITGPKSTRQTAGRLLLFARQELCRLSIFLVLDLQSTFDNSSLQGKSKKSSSYWDLEKNGRR